MELLYIFAAIILLIALLAIESHLRLRRIRRDRKGKGFTREQFVKAFRPIKISDDIPAAVYDNYRSHKGWEDFPFSPDDEYSKVLMSLRMMRLLSLRASEWLCCLNTFSGVG
jgi:hypothetical protein